MKSLLLAAVAVLSLTAPATADIITLGGVNWNTTGVDNLQLQATVPGGNQPQNIQCVICGDNQPQQSVTFGYTNFHNAGNINSVNMFSTNVSGGGNPGDNVVGLGYDGAFLRAYLIANGAPNLTFSIGIDLNDNNTPQTLNSFFLLNLTTHTVLSAFTTPTPLPNQNNGTGFPDYTLSGFDINLGTDIHVGDQLIFFARMTNMSDGPDSFFLVPNVQAVPGPVAGGGIPGLLVAMTGLFALHRLRRRRRTAG